MQEWNKLTLVQGNWWFESELKGAYCTPSTWSTATFCDWKWSLCVVLKPKSMKSWWYIYNVNRLWKIWVGGRGRFQRLVLFQLVSLFNVRWIEWWGVNKLFTVCSGNCGCRSSGANTCIGCGNLPHSQYGSSQEGVVMVLPLKLASASASAINTFFSSLFSQHNTHFGFLTLYDWLPKSSLIFLNVLLLSNGKISTSPMSWCYYFITSPHF